MTVVSNTSPVANLAVINQLELLRELHGEILIPRSVQDELGAGSQVLPELRQLLEQKWIRVAEVSPSPLLTTLAMQLDAGEAEAIALALQTRAGRLLLDERRARKIALRLGLPVMGVLGCLVDAKQKGIVPKVRPLILSLQEQAGFRVSAEVVAGVLARAHEQMG